MHEYETIDNDQRPTVTAGWLSRYLQIVKINQKKAGVSSREAATTNPKISKEKLRRGILSKISGYYTHENVHHIIWETVKEEWPPERWLHDEK
jgi:hypothetical protein